jgi:hypothetical protein
LASYFIALLQTRNITLNQYLSQVVPQMLLWLPGSCLPGLPCIQSWRRNQSGESSLPTTLTVSLLTSLASVLELIKTSPCRAHSKHQRSSPYAHAKLTRYPHTGQQRIARNAH